ncbi:hypothetical protein CC80DRAFT_409037 [Byssothecium circinans]|uniref:Sulfotransferase domain-containing protein n=1 Tax=Byssothecium circinans TaxID=147558 RepID=A0A6A5TZ23_9PLEO|nr:hypothetical protein CC80DRAFT_409037 [Byssothecium circinans]
MQPQTETITPQIRFLISCPGSGSTLLMRIFAEAPECVVTSRLILMGNHSNEAGHKFTPDYRILADSETVKAYNQTVADRRAFLASKEELGNDTKKGERAFKILPAPLNYNTMKPIFLVRDPVRIFDSWKHDGWTNMQSFFDCFENHFNMQDKHPTPPSFTLIYEKLIHDPEKEIRRICSYWDIPFNANMLSFKKDFSAFTLHTPREELLHKLETPHGLFNTVTKHSTIKSNIPPHNTLSNHEKHAIETRLGTLYLRLWKPEIDALRPRFEKAKWFAFDLDDTLHESRRASTAAITAVLSAIIRDFSATHTHPSHPLTLADLQTQYTKTKTPAPQPSTTAFTDNGNPSPQHQHHTFRLLATLSAFPLTPTDAQLASYTSLYETTFTANLELKCGVVELFTTLHSLGKKIAVVMEGPEDAQLRTIEHLGLRKWVQYVVEASRDRRGAGTTEGLYGELGVRAEEVVVVGGWGDGDGEDAGVVGVEEREGVWFGGGEEGRVRVRVNTLKKLEGLVRGV